MDVITIYEAEQAMKQTDRAGQPIPFSISFATWNRRTNSSDGIKHYHKAKLLMHERGKVLKPKTAARKSQHWKNATFNIQQLGKDHITKVHRDLVTRFNGKKVVYHTHG